MKKRNVFILFFLFLFSVVFFSSCSLGPIGTSHKIDFCYEVDNEEVIYKTIKTAGNQRITLPESPVSEDEYVFNGWYFDKDTFKEALTADYYVNKSLDSDIKVYAKLTLIGANYFALLDPQTGKSYNDVNNSLPDSVTASIRRGVEKSFKAMWSPRNLRRSEINFEVVYDEEKISYRLDDFSNDNTTLFYLTGLVESGETVITLKSGDFTRSYPVTLNSSLVTVEFYILEPNQKYDAYDKGVKKFEVTTDYDHDYKINIPKMSDIFLFDGYETGNAFLTEWYYPYEAGETKRELSEDDIHKKEVVKVYAKWYAFNTTDFEGNVKLDSTNKKLITNLMGVAQAIVLSPNATYQGFKGVDSLKSSWNTLQYFRDNSGSGSYTTDKDSPFRYCKSIHTVYSSLSSLELFPKDYLVNYIQTGNESVVTEGMFTKYPKLETINLKSTVSTFEKNTFKNCPILESINYQDGVAHLTSLGGDNFIECPNLVNEESTGLTYLKLLGNDHYALIKADLSITEVNLDKDTKLLAEYVFSNDAYGYPDITSFNYEGSMDEWNQINKGEHWNFGLPKDVKNTVHCSDGVVSI